MEYISTKEAAEKWGVSLRNVQRLLAEKRIAGAKKYGVSWFIPANAEKPKDPRREKKQRRRFHTFLRECPLLTMTSLYNEPGSAEAVAKSLAGEPEEQTVFRAGIEVMRGNIDGALKLAEELQLDEKKPDIFIANAFIHCMCALYKGDTKLWLFYKNKLKNLRCFTKQETAERDFWLGCIDLGLYDKTSLPDWFCGGNFDPLPKDSYPMARFSYIKYLIISSRNAKFTLLAKPLASECRKEGALSAEIYCRMIVATCCLECGDAPEAAKQIDRAIELALPDRLYAPLADYRDSLGTLFDDRLSLVDRKAVKTVRELCKQVQVGWSVLNRELYGLINITDLTQQERQAARLASRGLTNSEIAARMNLAVNTVKRYISEAMGKTGAQSRTELAKYIAIETPDE